MRIEIWSDIVCPWCYIGKRRLESALADFPHEVDIVWRSFQLDPDSPVEATETVAEHLGRKYGGGAEAGQRMIDNVEAVAAEEGLSYRLGEAKRVNTVDAHRLLHLARTQGLQGELKEALLAAYFTRAANVGDHDVLRTIGLETGLDAASIEATLASDEFRDEVYADLEQARAYGANGVPFFVIDGKYGISGAQPTDVFSRVLNQAWADSHPTLQMADSTTGEVCGPDGCAI